MDRYAPEHEGKKTWLGLDATVPYKNGITLEGGIGLEDIEGPVFRAENGGIALWARSSWSFKQMLLMAQIKAYQLLTFTVMPLTFILPHRGEDKVKRLD